MDLIIAWANGADIQIKHCVGYGWSDNNEPIWKEDCVYRIKPEVIRYRLGLQQLTSDKKILFIAIDGDCSPMRNGFIEWKTDWIEVEV
jgi:hypothetical protein